MADKIRTHIELAFAQTVNGVQYTIGRVTHLRVEQGYLVGDMELFVHG